MSSSFHPVTEVPVIETTRLILRGHRLDDFPDCAAMWADPIVTRHIGGKTIHRRRDLGKVSAIRRTLVGAGFRLLGDRRKGHCHLRRRVRVRRFQARHHAVPQGHARTGLGARLQSSRQRLCHGGSSGRCRLGQSALRRRADMLHNPSRESRIDSGCGKMWIPGIPAHNLQRPYHDHVCPVGDCRLLAGSEKKARRWSQRVRKQISLKRANAMYQETRDKPIGKTP